MTYVPGGDAAISSLTGSTAGAGAGMATALGVVGAVGALFGIAGAISQATALRRSIDRANEEAALAVAQARDKLSKIESLELELPMIKVDQIQKDSLRQRKQLLDSLRGSGQRAVLGGVPVIGEQVSKEKQERRGVLEKEIKDRQDKILVEEAKKDQLELDMLTAQGVAARQRATAAAKNEAAAIAGAGKSAAALGGEILGMSDLYGGEKRRFNRAVDQFVEAQGGELSKNFDREGFVDYLNTREESIEDLTEMLKDPDNTLFADFALEIGTETADIPGIET